MEAIKDARPLILIVFVTLCLLMAAKAFGSEVAPQAVSVSDVFWVSAAAGAGLLGSVTFVLLCAIFLIIVMGKILGIGDGDGDS